MRNYQKKLLEWRIFTRETQRHRPGVRESVKRWGKSRLPSRKCMVQLQQRPPDSSWGRRPTLLGNGSRAGVLPCVEAVACHIRIHRRTRIQCTFSQHPAQKDLKSHEKIPKQNLWSIGIIQEQYWLPLSLGGTLTTWVTGPIQPDFFPPWKCDQSNMCSCKKKKGCHRHMIIGGDQSILLRPVYGSLDGWRMRCQCAKKEWIQVAWKLPNGDGLCCY